MKTSLFLLGLAVPGYLSAQTVAAQERTAAAPQSTASCELHIFPTNEIIDESNNYNEGLGSGGIAGAIIGGALTSAQSSGSGKLRSLALEQMKTYLTPQAQIDEIKAAGVLSVLKLPPDTRIVEEAPLPRAYQKPEDPALLPAYIEYMNALKKSRAIKASAAPCYRELILVSISVAKNLGALKFSSEFVYRTFDSQLSETHLYDGQHSVPKPDHFPAQPGESPADAEAAVKGVFRTNFTEWVARRVKF